MDKMVVFDRKRIEGVGTVVYYITEREMKDSVTLYGIGVEKQTESADLAACQNMPGEMKTETNVEQTGPLSESKQKVKQLLEKMVRCTVTPETLNEVTDDWGYIFD